MFPSAPMALPSLLFVALVGPFLFLVLFCHFILVRPKKSKGKGITKKHPRKRSTQPRTFPITIGDSVEFHPHGYGTKRGLVAQLNRKTVRVVSDSPGEYWNVPPELLTKTNRSTAKPRRPRQLELIKGARSNHELN